MSLNHSAQLFAKRLAKRVPALTSLLTAIGENPIFNRNRPLKGLPWREVPIVINSFNRYSSLSRLIEWLIAAGHRNITIIDNASTYKPLIAYLAQVESDSKVRVIHLGGNFGHKALWDCNILSRLRIDTEFVYTDPDIVPSSSCPKDLVRELQSILREDRSLSKAGPALRLDDIPSHYRFKDDAISAERPFWLRPAARGAFLAPIDTTFALYRPHSHHELRGKAIRTGWPYLASHEGWFINHDHPNDEDQHYFATADPKVSMWSARTDPTTMEPTGERFTPRKSGLTLMNLGCGNDIIPGYLNLDNSPNPLLDIKFDLDSCADNRIPLAADSVDGFYACHVVEHVRNALPLMQELHRIAKPNARMIIRVPYGSADDSMEDPTHVRPYFENSFSYFAQPAYSRADYGYVGDWEIERVILVVNQQLEHFPKWITRQAVRRMRNIVHEMIVHLRAVKPVRQREYRLYRLVKPDVVFSRFDAHEGFSDLQHRAESIAAE